MLVLLLVAMLNGGDNQFQIQPAPEDIKPIMVFYPDGSIVLKGKVIAKDPDIYKAVMNIKTPDCPKEQWHSSPYQIIPN